MGSRANHRRWSLFAGAITVAVFGLAAPDARPSGFLIYDQSAAALAQASAVVGDAKDAAANWYNPAGLVFGAPVAGSATLALAGGRVSFAPVAAAPANSKVNGTLETQAVPNAFGAVRVSRRVHVGLGVYAPYGLSLAWPEQWVGREEAISVLVQVIAINSNVALRLTERWAVAVGASALYARVRFGFGLPAEVGSQGDLRGDDWGWQANFAVMWKAIPDVLSLGASYRGLNFHGRPRFDLQGPADFTLSNPSLAQTFPDQAARTSLALPDIMSVGATWQLHPHVKLGLQFDYTRWSAFERLEVQFEQPATPPQVIERRSQDALTMRIGTQFRMWHPRVPMRVGVTFDQTSGRPQTLAPSAPDGHRIGLAFGAGYEWNHLRVDVGYQWLQFLPAEAKGGLEGPIGTYTTRLHMLAVTFSGQTTGP